MFIPGHLFQQQSNPTSIEGYDQKGGPGPALKLVSLYVDQFPKGDLSRDLARKYDVPIL